jgi:hypothetical protein
MKDYTAYSTLEDALPPLVRKQRRLEGRLVLLVPLAEEEKALRHEIDALLLAEGFAHGEGVTCLGYDVKHNARKGQSSLNPQTIVGLLVAGGVDEAFALKVLIDSTETADDPQWATVKPSKGSRVRTNVATGKRSF